MLTVLLVVFFAVMAFNVLMATVKLSVKPTSANVWAPSFFYFSQERTRSASVSSQLGKKKNISCSLD